MTPTKNQILNQLHSLRLKGFDKLLGAAAKAKQFPDVFYFAIASRETNCLNILGDFHADGAHGVGIVQIDIQHPLAKDARDSNSWKTDPGPLIQFGAGLLAQNIAAAKEAFPEFTIDQHLKIAASGYNCGVARAIAAARHGDSDSPTTGHDYGRDVMTRMAIFAELVAEGH